MADPEISLLFSGASAQTGFSGNAVEDPAAMFVIEALHPDGWRVQGRAKVEYWACQEAQTRCCSDGRNYRILEADSARIVALIDTSSCRLNPRRHGLVEMVGR